MTDNISIFLGLLKDRPHFHIFMLVKRQIIYGNIGDMRAKVTIKAQYYDFGVSVEALCG